MELENDMGVGMAPREAAGPAPREQEKRRTNAAVFDRPAHVGRRLPVSPAVIALILAMAVLAVILLVRVL